MISRITSVLLLLAIGSAIFLSVLGWKANRDANELYNAAAVYVSSFVLPAPWDETRMEIPETLHLDMIAFKAKANAIPGFLLLPRAKDRIRFVDKIVMEYFTINDIKPTPEDLQIGLAAPIPRITKVLGRRRTLDDPKGLFDSREDLIHHQQNRKRYARDSSVR